MAQDGTSRTVQLCELPSEALQGCALSMIMRPIRGRDPFLSRIEAHAPSTLTIANTVEFSRVPCPARPLSCVIGNLIAKVRSVIPLDQEKLGKGVVFATLAVLGAGVGVIFGGPP